MTYRLKTIRYKNSEVRILLQNENGPCPLLAAANALLLRQAIQFPAHCIRNSVASLEDVTNMLANQALASNEDATYHVNELLSHIPTFQYGMDVNPDLCTGDHEYTAQLTSFDLLRVKLVHGWIVDPIHDELVATAMQASSSTMYNALIERVIQGNEAAAELPVLLQEIQKMEGGVDFFEADSEDKMQHLQELKTKYDQLYKVATDGSLIHNFLESTSHQLTQYGLERLYETVQNDELVVFFRNNHFSTLTKHEDILYLLVTDLGYANVPNIVWEKLDVIDGDTEYVNSQFQPAGVTTQDLMSGPTLSPEQLYAQSGRNEADYQLALQLSKQQHDATANLDAQEGELMAAATEASLRSYHGIPDPPTTTNPPQQRPNIAVGVPLGGTVAGTAASAPASLHTMQPTVAALPSHSAGAATQPPQQHGIPMDEMDKLYALQLQNDEDASLRLARQLQAQEDAAAAARNQQPPRQTATTAGKSGCVIS